METKMNKRSLGSRYEELALRYALEQGAICLQKNFRCRLGEIDLILREGRYLVFAEVKYRSSQRFGGALEAVDVKKQRKICRVSDYYRRYHLPGDFPADPPIRFDVFAIAGDPMDGSAGGGVRIQWIRDAFFYLPQHSSFS